MPAKLYKNIKLEDRGIRKLRIGDLNNDGIPELVLAQTYPMNREMACVTVIDLEGNVLWEHGDPIYANWAYSDYPVQVIDWDGDGKLEVLYVKQAVYTRADMWNYTLGKGFQKEITDYNEVRFNLNEAVNSALEYDGSACLMVLDGSTGTVKQSYEIPAPADDCFAFGHFDGTGKWNVLVKDRYMNAWAIDNDGNILWHVTNKDLDKKGGLGHYPGVGDIDGDGLDEVYLTNALIDHDGTIKWRVDKFCDWMHSDSAYILDDLPEPHVIMCGDRIRLITAQGKVLWEKDGGHWQGIVPGRFSMDPKHGPYQFIAWDINPGDDNYIDGAEGVNKNNLTGQKLVMFDWYGNQLWSRLYDCVNFSCVNWNGVCDSLAIMITIEDDPEKKRAVFEILDGEGNCVASHPYVGADGEDSAKWFILPYIADVAGDGRDEVLLLSNTSINIFINTDVNQPRHHYNHSGFNMVPSHR